MFLLDQLIHPLITNDLVPVKAAHDGISVAKRIEAGAEYAVIQKAVLAENIDGIVLYRGAGKDQFVRRRISQPVHGLALCGVVGFDTLAFVGNDKVGIVADQRLEDFITPGRLVICNSDLEAFPG